MSNILTSDAVLLASLVLFFLTTLLFIGVIISYTKYKKIDEKLKLNRRFDLDNLDLHGEPMTEQGEKGEY